MALMGPKVKVLRLDQRSGLIKARMAGAAYSTGEVNENCCTQPLLNSMLLVVRGQGS